MRTERKIRPIRRRGLTAKAMGAHSIRPGGRKADPRCATMADMVNAARARTFVVTGAASGIGLATAKRLLADGGSVVGADLAAPPDLGPDFRFVTADVTDEAAVAAVLAAVPERLDGVFHAAGVAGGGPVHLLDRAEWDRVIGINLTGTFLVAKAALARMIEQPRVDGERG
ncbi:hypothetical protein MHEI_01900 [Mycobacterium heidelbergense]|nr:hypothetical protein MHEI_01900 [Mycobacterium heidelbergense]